jgi:hypothetical protein
MEKSFSSARSDWYVAMDKAFGAVRKITPFK